MSTLKIVRNTRREKPPASPSATDLPSSAGPALRVLMIEDNIGDAELIRIAFKRSSKVRTIEIQHFEYLRGGLDFLNTNHVDIILLDLSLPDSHGIESLTSLKQKAPHLPVIILTGWDDRTISLEGIRGGAQDYLIKGSFDYSSLIPTIDYAIERQKIKNAIEGNQLRSQQENEFKKEVLEVVAHDLRSPLTGVLMQLEGVLNGSVVKNLSPEQKHIFEQMHENCKQVVDLSKSLLELDSLKSKDFFTPQTVDLSPFVQKTFDSFAPIALRKGIELTLNLGKLKPIKVDPKRIAQLLNNFISNALKFSHQGAIVLVSAKCNANELAISVRDSGQGIPKEDLSKLFIEFSRTRIRPTAGEDSAGIGLAIVKRIADAHNGRLWVESEFGEGSTFSFAIPLHLS